MKPNQRADGARQCVFCELPPADPIHVNWERGSPHPFWADGARETIPGKEETLRQMAACGDHSIGFLVGCRYCEMGYRMLERAYDAGSSQVAALTRQLNDAEKVAELHLREVQKLQGIVTDGDEENLALARRNEQLEAENARLRGGQGAAMALNNKGEPSKKGGATQP